MVSAKAQIADFRKSEICFPARQSPFEDQLVAAPGRGGAQRLQSVTKSTELLVKDALEYMPAAASMPDVAGELVMRG
jgi:hypothetical protein